MKAKRKTVTIIFVILLFIFIANPISAHCDSMNGPVVKAIISSLNTENLDYTLIWLKPEVEKEIKTLFSKVLNIRKLSPEAKELVDMYFIETVVRLHRAGEGVGYTGIKPVDYKPEEGIEAADAAIDKNNVNDILKHVSEQYHSKVISLFNDVQSAKNFDINNIEAGRKYVGSYVTFIHYVEGLFGGENSAQEKHIHNH